MLEPRDVWRELELVREPKTRRVAPLGDLMIKLTLSDG